MENVLIMVFAGLTTLTFVYSFYIMATKKQ